MRHLGRIDMKIQGISLSYLLSIFLIMMLICSIYSELIVFSSRVSMSPFRENTCNSSIKPKLMSLSYCNESTYFGYPNHSDPGSGVSK